MTVDSGFIEYALRRMYESGTLDAMQTQTTNLRNLDFNSFLDLPIMLAPLARAASHRGQGQSLLEQVNRAKVRLDRAAIIVQRLRSAVLDAACSGELTAAWRGTSRLARTPANTTASPHESTRPTRANLSVPDVLTG